MSNKGSGYTNKNFVKTKEISRAESSHSGIKKSTGNIKLPALLNNQLWNAKRYFVPYASYFLEGLYTPSRYSPVRLGIFIFIPGIMRLGSCGLGIFCLFA